MAKRVQRLRAITAAADAFVGKEGEITVDTTKSTLRVHDGATPGGRETARDDLSNVNAATVSNPGKMSTAQASLLTATAGISQASKALIMSSGNAINSININSNGLKLNSVAVTSTAAELNVTDGATPGTAIASKAAVLDSSKNFSGIAALTLATSLTLTGTTVTGIVGVGTKLDAFEGTADPGSNPTAMLFHQSVAPTGWVKDTASTYNNSALRLVTSTAWSAADMTGSSFTTIFGASKNTGGSLSTNVISHLHAAGSLIALVDGAHTHDVAVQTGGSSGSLVGNMESSGGATVSNAALSAGAHTHTVAGSTANTSSGSTHTHTMALDIDYISMIRAVKA